MESLTRQSRKESIKKPKEVDECYTEREKMDVRHNQRVSGS